MPHPSEIVALRAPGQQPIEVIRRNYELKAETPRFGETIFTALGHYAIFQPDHQAPWQFAPIDHHPPRDTFSEQWASADDLRTRAYEGTFLPEHMDALDASLFERQRVTNANTQLAITSEAELRRLLAAHDVPTDQWTASVHRLYSDIKLAPAHQEVENIALHIVKGALWLSTAQTMLNVYYTNADNTTYKLQETDTTHFDANGNSRTTKSKLRSSLGETGHITNGQPERPYSTARRGLLEELGIEDDDHILKIVSIGSLLRLKEAGHHSFKTIKAEDRTHYFRADLNPRTVQPEYINNEYDPDGRLRARIKLEWFPHEPK
ncbi:MAG TPA: hypothetical protein VFZ48_01245 [Candidatus Saccharimonadales bacterium]